MKEEYMFSLGKRKNIIFFGDCMNNEKIGKYIKKLRTEKGMSQNELGNIVHVTRQAISSWENGKTLPDSDILVSLSKLFQVSINQILSGNEEKDIEKVALDLIDENNQKTKRIRKMALTTNITILTLLTIFLGLYFIENYNSIKVYKTYGETKNFIINEGLIISTSKDTYFKLGQLNTKQGEMKIERIKLYYKQNEKKETIFSNELSDRLYIQKKGYNELHKGKFEKYKNNIYLEIIYNDNQKEIMKLKMKEKFKNDTILSLEESNVLKKEKNNLMNKEIEESHMIEQKEIIEEKIIQEEPKIEYQKIVEEKEEVPLEEEKEMNYEEIAKIITEHGRAERRTYLLEYQIEEKIIVISTFRNMINVEIQYENINKTWNNNISSDINILYQEYNRNELVDTINITQENKEEKKEIIEEMNNYLSLVYQEIE